MRNELSKAEQSALLAATARVGARVPGCPRSLIDSGHATEAGHLTRKGSIARERVQAEALDKAFG